jgi:hypothetical protein
MSTSSIVIVLANAPSSWPNSGETKNPNPVAVISSPMRLSGRRRQDAERAEGAADEAEDDVDSDDRRLAVPEDRA